MVYLHVISKDTVQVGSPCGTSSKCNPKTYLLFAYYVFFW